MAYAGEKKKFSKKQNKWITVESEKAYDYDGIDRKSASLMISFFRFYPDYYADLCRSPNATYKLELAQRIMMRTLARYRNVYITGCRGLTKTYIILLEKMIEGQLYPGEKLRYNAPAQKQAAALATQAFKQISIDYPIIAASWNIRNDREDMFRITTAYGSEFTMYAPRGDNCSQTIAEEIGQEAPEPFDIENYEKSILPTCRIVRYVNQKRDRVHINQKHSHISNACSKQNPAYTKHRYECLKAMLIKEKYQGYVLDYSWITALLCNIRDINYIEDNKSKLTPEDWLKEMCARYTGTGDSPLISDESLSRSRVNNIMELKHNGDPNAWYIVSHDVSYEDGAKNAKCADVVLKLTKYDQKIRRDKFRKQVVFVDTYPPPSTAYEQAQKVRNLWEKYCFNGGQPTYLVIDAQAYGKEIVEELMKPQPDNKPTLCCYQHMRYQEIEQPHSLDVIYPMKASRGSGGSADSDGEMIKYAQLEFENGTVELLTSKILDGIEQYKLKNRIKDDNSDVYIAQPYKKCDELCQQIGNLQTRASGLTIKEVRKSQSIQRDIWSALKYALRMAQRIEDALKKETYASKGSWQDIIATQKTPNQKMGKINTRSKLLQLRK